MIRAASYDEALEIIADHPHADFGSIELREIDNMGDGDDGP